MSVALRPLFGLTCVGEAMPPGSDIDCAAALAEASPLRAAVERAPAPGPSASPGYDLSTPSPEPDLSPSPSYAPGMRR